MKAKTKKHNIHNIECSECGEKARLPLITIEEKPDEDGNPIDVYSPHFCIPCQNKITLEIEEAYTNNEFDKVVEILCETCTNMFDSMLHDVSINPRILGKIQRDTKDIKKLDPHIKRELK